ncbi:hypothetical protein ACTFIW_005788 [Dictyostelium discoideum]
MNLFITILILVISYIIFFKNNNRISKINSKIPGPIRLPILGNLHQIKKDPHFQFQKWYKKYGEIFSIRLGNIETVVFTGYPIFKKAYIENSQIFASRYQQLSRFETNGYKNLIGSNDELHSILKKTILSEITSNKIKKMEYHIALECENLCKQLDKHCQDGLPFSLNMYCKLFSLNIILRFLFGSIDNSYQDKSNQEMVDVIIEYLHYGGNPIVSDYIPILKPFYKKNKFFILYPVMCDHINKLIEIYKNKKQQKKQQKQQQKQQNEDNHDDVDDDDDDDDGTIIGKLLNEYNKGNISWTSVVSTCIDVFLAGVDSTSNTIIFSLIALVNNSNCQEKLYNEIKNNLLKSDNDGGGDEIIAIRHSLYRSSITYLSLIMKEVYRLHTVILIGLPHITTEDVEIEGYKIAKGTQVLQNVFSTHLCEKTFPMPKSFIPERFTETGSNNMFGGGQTNLIHFGTGVRDCVGKSLADCEFFTVLATLINRYQFINPTSVPLNDIGSFGIAYQPPINNFIIKKRL